MVIGICGQLRNHALPLRCVTHYTGSALPVLLPDVPAIWCGREVTGVKMQIVNADGVPTVRKLDRCASGWAAIFPASGFAAYGFVQRGVSVTLMMGDEEERIGTGDIEIIAQDANAVPGDPEGHAITREELAELFAAMELADTATQREVRQALQLVITKLKGVAQ